jgi:hypothetical protein
MDYCESMANCLTGCLTILIKLKVIDEKEALSVIHEKGYEGLFDFLDEKFLEIKNKE